MLLGRAVGQWSPGASTAARLGCAASARWVSGQAQSSIALCPSGRSTPLLKQYGFAGSSTHAVLHACCQGCMDVAHATGMRPSCAFPKQVLFRAKRGSTHAMRGPAAHRRGAKAAWAQW
eukprot:scaffold6686_cov31-Tisochrysis_lutea.AAC.1